MKMIEYVKGLAGEFTTEFVIAAHRSPKLDCPKERLVVIQNALGMKRTVEQHPLVGEIKDSAARVGTITLTWKDEEEESVAETFEEWIGTLLSQKVNHTSDKFVKWDALLHGSEINLTWEKLGAKSERTSVKHTAADKIALNLLKDQREGKITKAEMLEQLTARLEAELAESSGEDE
jgi:hypothetical protein